MNDSLIILLSDIFFQQQKKGNDPFIIIKFSVPCKLLYELYERLSKVDVPVIESLSNDEKTRFWSIAKKYYISEQEAVKGSKSAYILSLITSLESVEDKVSTIDCGIGTINYEADNIALQDIMENLDAAIQKTNFRKVNEHLQSIVTNY